MVESQEQDCFTEKTPLPMRCGAISRRGDREGLVWLVLSKAYMLCPVVSRLRRCWPVEAASVETVLKRMILSRSYHF